MCFCNRQMCDDSKEGSSAKIMREDFIPKELLKNTGCNTESVSEFGDDEKMALQI